MLTTSIAGNSGTLNELADAEFNRNKNRKIALDNIKFVNPSAMINNKNPDLEGVEENQVDEATN